MDVMKYIKPELLIVTVVLYFIDKAIKQSEIINDKYIPLINAAVGIFICAFYVASVCVCNTRQDYAQAIFTTITQGSLVAGLSTYVSRFIKTNDTPDEPE